MNQPTREEFNNHETRIKKLEQQTEPIPVAHVEGTPEDILKKLNAIDKKLDRIDTKQDEHATGLLAHSKSISILQTETQGVKADTLAIRASQSDFKEKLEEHGQLLKTMATKKDLEAMETRIIETVKQLLQQKPGEGQP
jgi:chromosome segregation ATPase